MLILAPVTRAFQHREPLECLSSTQPASYGSVPVIRDVTIKIDYGEAVGLLGANGAGKSTTLRAISA